MPALRRLIVIILAFLVAAIAASAVILGVTFSRMIALTPGTPLPGIQLVAEVLYKTGGIVFLATTALTFLPAMIIAAIAEISRLRSVLFYMGAASALSVIATIGLTYVISLRMTFPGSPRPGFSISLSGLLSLWPFAVAGVTAGLVYWALAGRNAGAWRHANDLQRRGEVPNK